MGYKIAKATPSKRILFLMKGSKLKNTTMSFLENLINSIKALGLSKELIFDGTGYEPSEFSRALFVANKTDYDGSDYDTPYTDADKKILVICTQEKYLTMNNGKKFSTGNHPVETLVPMLHYEKAGFSCDIYTPTGAAGSI